MKRKALAIVLTLLMLVSVLPMGAFAASYSDTEGHWAEKSIDRWTDAKVLEGMGNNKYAPDDNLTRAQAMTIFSRLLKLTEKADISGLTDVAADAWYAPYIETGYAYQIIKGTSDTTFDPSGNITREQFFSVFARAVGIPPASTCDKTFTDLDQVSSWFVEEGTVYSMINRGYLDGYPDGSLKPQRSITRAEVAKVLDNAISDYITEDGTYAISGDGIVVVLAKDVKLTGNFNGHIVSSCPDSTLDLSGLNGTPYIYVLGDNTKIINAKPGTKVAVNPAADNVTANGVKVTYNPYYPSSPYIVPAPGGGGGSSSPTTTSKYVMTVFLKAQPDSDGVTLSSASLDATATLADALKSLAANGKDGFEAGVTSAFKRMADKTYTSGNYTIDVKVLDGNTGFSVTAKDNTTGNLVNIQEALNDEYTMYTNKMDTKSAEAGVTAGVDALKAAIKPDNVFVFSDGGTKATTKSASDIAGVYAATVEALAQFIPAMDTAKAQTWTANKWVGETVFGDNFADLTTTVKSTIQDLSGKKLVDVTEAVNDVAGAKAAINKFTGRDYEGNDKAEAVLDTILSMGSPSFKGDYTIRVSVEEVK